jgi:V8-like Glu-specific endopeptidase
LAFVGAADKRKYVDWNQSPYNSILKMPNAEKVGRCTAQFVAPNIILTAEHCARACYVVDGAKAQKSYIDCSFITSNGNILEAQTVAVGEYSRDNTDKNDFNILKLKDKNISHSHFNMSIQNINVGQKVDVLGFGGLRILSDEELAIIRKKILTIVRGENWAYVGAIPGVDSYRQSRDAKALDNVDKNRELNRFVSDLVGYLEEALAKDTADGKAMSPIFSDSNNLKLSTDCSVTSVDEKQFYTSCDIFNGNSGGAVLLSGTNTLIGVISIGIQQITDNHQYSFDKKGGFSGAMKVSQFYDIVQNLIKNQEITKPNTDWLKGM